MKSRIQAQIYTETENMSARELLKYFNNDENKKRNVKKLKNGKKHAFVQKTRLKSGGKQTCTGKIVPETALFRNLRAWLYFGKSMRN